MNLVCTKCGSQIKDLDTICVVCGNGTKYIKKDVLSGDVMFGDNKTFQPNLLQPSIWARFELKDDNHNKFWEIKYKDKSYTARWGRIGNDPQYQDKWFSTDASAKQAAIYRMQEKLNKGYKYINSFMPDGTPLSKPQVEKKIQEKKPQAKTVQPINKVEPQSTDFLDEDWSNVNI